MRWIPLALLLTGCAGTLTTPPPVDVQQVCLPLPAYSPAQEHQMAQAVAALAAGNPLLLMLSDYGAMRAADRACLSAQGSHK